MGGSTISNLVTVSVTLGTFFYMSPLAVLSAGEIATTNGTPALVGDVEEGFVLNDGLIAGGGGEGTVSAGNGMSGGVGVNLGLTTLVNQGTIVGGSGSHVYTYRALAGAGGTGLIGNDSTMLNAGTLLGGAAVAYTFNLSSTGLGGDGASVTASMLGNTGLIEGGNGSPTFRGQSNTARWGIGGAGVRISDGSLSNSGSIISGAPGDSSQLNQPAEAGVVAYGSEVTNSGEIGGRSVGVSLVGGSILLNAAVVFGGPGAYAGNGYDAVDSTNSNLTNTGTIIGGAGGATFSFGLGFPGPAAAGVHATSSTLENMGTILGGQGSSEGHLSEGGSGGSGVILEFGVLTNSGEIVGGQAVVLAMFAFGGTGLVASNATIVNQGSIAGGTGSEGGAGVGLSSSYLTNAGLILSGSGQSGMFGGSGGIYASDSTITNSGSIISTSGSSQGKYGVSLNAGELTNTGLIQGAYGPDGGGPGVAAESARISNTGTIHGGNYVISEPDANGFGVSLIGTGIVSNAGFISGGQNSTGAITDAVYLGGSSSRLIVGPSAVFVGAVVAAESNDTLELSAGGDGTITGLGSSFSGFGTVTVDPDANWTVEAAVTGASAFGVGAGACLMFQGAVSAPSSVAFLTSPGTLGLQDPAGFAATLFSLDLGDAINFVNLPDTGSTVAGVNASNDLTLTSNGSLLASVTLDPTQNFSNVSFQASSDGGGTTVTETPLCFLAGTMIATPAGQTPVQALRPGNYVVTAFGAARPIVWIGTGSTLATPGRRSSATPIIIRKSALAANVPNRDLRLTRAHALWFDGSLIPVEFLVNHRSILWDDTAREVSLYHVELETHDALLANGAAAESYRDDGNRWLFQTVGNGRRLPPGPPCAPVLTDGPLVDATWRRLLDRAAPRPGLPLTDEPDLHLRADGRRIDAMFQDGPCHVFRLWSGFDDLRIVSNAAAPQELGLSRDPRVLGVAVQRLVIVQGKREVAVTANDPRLNAGFHPFEPALGLRWTNGGALLSRTLFEGFDGKLELHLHTGGKTWFVCDDDIGRTRGMSAALSVDHRRHITGPCRDGFHFTAAWAHRATSSSSISPAPTRSQAAPVIAAT